MSLSHLYDLKGQTALITGASSGLGAQFAHTLSAAGARVILSGRRMDKLEQLSRQLSNSCIIQMDVTNPKDIEKCLQALESRGEKIHICVNSAGIAKRTPLFQENASNDFEAVLQTNLMGVWHVTYAMTKHMKANALHGSIINIGSINGAAVPSYGAAAYAASKAAVIHLTKALVGELAPHNIRINCISPGWFKTPMTEHNVEKVTPHIPCGFMADPSDLDGLILYLASYAASRYVTGSCFTIDGGLSWGGKKW